jgi:xanthine dehydrogenase accessory factor
MRDVLDELRRWWDAGERAALATVVATWSSAPRPAGSAMLVAPDGSVTGSVSGGCVEGAVYDLAQQVARTGAPTLQRFGVSDSDAFEVGLSCGGTIEVYVEPVDAGGFPEFGEVADTIRDGVAVAVVTCVAAGAPDDPAGRLGRRLVVWADRHRGTLGADRLDQAVLADVRGMLAAGRTGTLRYGYTGRRDGTELTLFVAAHTTAPRMIIFGAVDFAAALSRLGALLGYRVTVCDARAVFATERRFPDADEVVVDWPHRYLAAQLRAGLVDARTVVCVLTHDPKFDVPLLELALRTPLAYVGAMGSRRTHADRLARLRDRGLREDELDRLAAPIGLDLGARTQEEVAVSIAAEIIAQRWGGSGARLRSRTDSIHR